MLLLDGLELILYTVLAWIGFTQILVPIWRGSHVFPLVRKCTDKNLGASLDAAIDDVEHAEIERLASLRRKEAQKIRRDE